MLLNMRAQGFPGGGSGAPVDATYIVQTPNATLTNEQALSTLATGLLKNTTGTGVLSIAAQGTDYYAPGGTDVAVADGGTGASTAAAARTNLGLVAGGAGDIWVEKAGDTMIGPLVIDGSTDAKQLIVQGHSTQTNPIQEWQTSDGNELAYMDLEGLVISKNHTLPIIDQDFLLKLVDNNPGHGIAAAYLQNQADDGYAELDFINSGGTYDHMFSIGNTGVNGEAPYTNAGFIYTGPELDYIIMQSSKPGSYIRLDVGGFDNEIARLTEEGFITNGLNIRMNPGSFDAGDYSAFVVGNLEGEPEPDFGNGGLYAIARADGANQPFTALAGFDYDEDARVLYFGGGDWGVPDATRLEFWVADTYDETPGAAKIKLAVTDGVRVGNNFNQTIPVNAILSIDQNDDVAAIPALRIKQSDLSEEFIRFETTVGAGNPVNTTALGAYYGRVRVNIEGVGVKWLALYN